MVITSGTSARPRPPTTSTPPPPTRQSPAPPPPLTYNSAGQLATITDPAGRTYTLTWTNGHITQLQDTAGRTVSYAYDANNNLTDVLGVGTTRTPSVLNNDHTQFTYTSTHLMTSMRTPNNYGGAAGAVTAMTYDTSERVTNQTDPLGRATTFTYGPNGGLQTGQTQVTDPAGHTVLDTYANGLLTSETKGAGSSTASTWTYTYDPLTLGVSTETDPNGAVSTYSYDDQGHRASASDPNGNTTNYLYDTAGDLVETIDPTGVATLNLYDQAGHISTGSGTTNNGAFTYGDITSSTITQANNIAESTTGNFGPAPTRTTNFFYDTAADPADQTRVVNPAGNTTTATFDAYGDVATVTDPIGRKALRGYDTARGWVTYTVAPSGTAAGTKVGCTPPAAGCNSVSYDAYGNAVLTTDPLGHTTKATYDANGNKTSATDGDNNTTRTTYDAADQATTTTQADGTTLTRTYNGDGTLASSKDAAGAATTYGYDAQARRTTSTNPDSRVTTTGYDPAGHTVSVKDPAGATTTDTVDANGQLTATSYSDGATPNVTGITYDPDGRRTAMSDGTGTSTWAYDVFGATVTTVNGAGATTHYAYDNAGNQTTITYPTGATVTNGYDTANQITSVTDLAGKKTTFGYSTDGENTTTTYPNGSTITNAFNAANQQTSTTAANGSTTLGGVTYSRDNAGQLSTSTPSGSIPGAATTYSYTALQQVKAAATTGSTSSYAYDQANNVTTNAGTTATYDAANQLCWGTNAAVTGSPSCTNPPSSATKYTYDTDGRRTGATPPNGTASSYTYNQADELTKAATPVGSANYTYDGNGQRTTKTVGNTTTAFTWSDALLLSDSTNQYVYGPGGPPIEQVTGSTTNYFVHDQLGSTIALLSSTGSVSAGYAYTPYGTVASHTGTATTPQQYAGGYYDAETGLIYLRARYYDPTTGMFITVDPAETKTGDAYSYAGDNPINRIDISGLFWYNPTTWTANTWVNLGIGALDVVELVATDGVAAPLIAEEDTALESASVGEEAAGIVYRRTSESTEPYVGQAISDERFLARQGEHARANPFPEDPYEFEILGRAKPGDDLDALEEYHIRDGGGPTNKGNPNGGLSNKRHQMNPQRYNDYSKNNPGVFDFDGFGQCAAGE